jgi:hypothetical protein
MTSRQPLHLSDGVRRQLVHDALTMRLDRSASDEQAARDLLVGMTSDE